MPPCNPLRTCAEQGNLVITFAVFITAYRAGYYQNIYGCSAVESVLLIAFPGAMVFAGWLLLRSADTDTVHNLIMRDCLQVAARFISPGGVIPPNQF
ncbi:MAG: hypothetical protein CMI04_09605 [Oceanospirillaceae bacterium]|nr:hypothetical protein [Oceanospirillaceae bacterium]